MRTYFKIIFLLAVVTLLANSKATSPKPQDLIQRRSGRVLRADATYNQATNAVDEERASIPELISKLGKSVPKWFGDKYLATRLRLKAVQMNLDNVVEKLVKEGVDPNRAYKVLKLKKDSNQFVGMHETGEYKLWHKLVTAYQKKYPKWVNLYA
ncbi:secreted RxLR effector peptide protein, putative [Phytophthora infestans T30-4]|uniref:Secreted RxLR effector peptide protein, putative n=1 Tax=Phytophthora infestans (strain T30-4) TaxID=403677 RepID=D0N943_PHYIT|nr:secreted RxLR effector peptide protein, putative [Phytophthora infestans T30-4]EEY54331.1 secreted RxLR effector peptide protein, putative [Phytophthora infestans T30-4]|eukprot:XP_002904153.1 secreted RxLR effector peptide protein, putative [Phytophthora infestans T30-4]